MGRGRRASEITLAPIGHIPTSNPISSILPFSNNCFTSNSHDNLRWYDWWVHQQVEAQPKELFSTIMGGGHESDARCTESFGRVWQETAEYLTTNQSGSIDDVLNHLLEIGFLQSTDDPSSYLMSKSLVFAIVGWQTMLYRPDIKSCPFSELAIESQMGLHQGQCHMSLKQGSTAGKKPMHKFLLGYGMLLPPRQFSVLETTEEKEAFHQCKTVSPESFNVHFLAVFGGITIEWIDSLPCHLEFDSDSNTLFLFRYPSYCLANLETNNSAASKAHGNVLYACGNSSSSCQWATTEEIAQMLQETILSFRLLFGQSRASRKLFGNLEPFQNMPDQSVDQFLTTICAQKRFKTSAGFHERESYELHRDFPILRSRLAVLITHLSSKTPRTWRQHWQDNRNSASWLTFWAVIAIGGMGIILAFLQVILQIIQIVKS